MSDEAYPDIHVWTIPLRPRPGVEQRTYEQRELSMDGEARLFSLLAQTAERLRKDGFDFGALINMFPDVDPDNPTAALSQYERLDFGALAGMLGKVAEAAPFLLSEGAATLLGIFPVDYMGNRNTKYREEVAFLRQNLHLSDVVEMLEVAWSQNDTKRLLSPFVRAAKEVMYQYGAARATQEPSVEG